MLRFRFHRPHECCSSFQILQREPLHFTAAEGYDPQRRLYISADEIDKLLRGGKRSTDYRLAVYSFYRNHTERKERENFLKHYHGEYSGHSGGNDDVTYQLSKGVSFQPRQYHRPLRQGGAEMERRGKARQRHDRPGAVPHPMRTAPPCRSMRSTSLPGISALSLRTYPRSSRTPIRLALTIGTR